ncbi:hypothetical protein C0989_002520 [Termitomyces sp. Mn162]|nr:hypothetical protein C0989_002520 [Termitomyces sp. Mn162]
MPEFFVTQQAAAQAMTDVSAASNLGSNDDDDVPMSKQCILDSDFNDDATEHCCKEWHNANARWLLAIDAEKSKLDLKHLNDTMPGHLPDGWDTTLVYGHFECQNDFRDMLHSNFYWSPMTNAVFVGDKVVFAHSTKMVGISHISPQYKLLYKWAPQEMSMNPEQIYLILELIQVGRLKVAMREQIHAALLLQEFYWISFYTAPQLRDSTMK